MPKVLVNGVNLHYWQVGEGPDLIMLHGLGGNLAVWHFAMVRALRDRFRITTYDLRGHGHSDMPPTGYTTHNMACDLKCLMDALAIDQASLWGHSFGADIVLHFALLHSDRVHKLVVIDAMLPIMLHTYMRKEWEGWAYWAQMLEQITGVKPPPDKWRDIKYMLSHSFEVPILFGPFRGRARNRVPITQLLTETTIMEDFNQVDELTVDNFSEITAPTLLLYEENSPFIPTYKALLAGLPSATSALLPSGELRHFSPLEQPTVILQHATPFLQLTGTVSPTHESEIYV